VSPHQVVNHRQGELITMSLFAVSRFPPLALSLMLFSGLGWFQASVATLHK
jgi:hypothetical protein